VTSCSVWSPLQTLGNIRKSPFRMTPRQRKTERGRKKNDDANKPSAALAEYASGYQRGKRRLIFATFVLIAGIPFTCAGAISLWTSRLP
jgi:hypothetical protein